MTNSDLTRIVQKRHSFNEMQRLLGIEHAEYHIMEGGATDRIVYRYMVAHRILFLRVDQPDNFVSRAFFADKGAVGPQKMEGTNIVTKPY
jgi:hypothetical protein